ncbi:MAG: carotenoid 1,2-hydratase [Betaproteobacteria bacterium HGW-Betaproteobacteria-7]|jgi:predicted secreted hydrolase|nr:MAG: carotenoid 1,2-hydratase [Betaproteobacteria bacterium HGW-Betaproteobacteria-7]
MHGRRAFLKLLASLPAWPAGAALAVPEFAAVIPGRPLVFPRDHGAHPEFRTEWWYATGWLALPDGRPLGFQSTFFRIRTGLGEDNPSAFAPRQLLVAHAALADPALGQLRHDQRSARSGLGRAGFSEERTQVWIGDWRFEQEGNNYRTAVRAADFAYALELRPDGPPLLNGAGGFSQKAPDPRHASYYYSRPQLAVAGTVTLAGRQQAVSGRAWLDHEWSSELLPAGAQGWDWIGINLDDGGALMAFRLRQTDGTALWAAATFRPAGGAVQVLAPESISFTPLRRWRSPRTDIDYPVEWQVRIADRSFQLRPLFDDQELDSRRSTGAVYWEGAVRLSEAGREIGRGYLEMTGYGEAIRV